MIERNDAARALTNADRWHDAGYTGKDVHVVVIDSKSTPHDHMTYASAPLLDGTHVGHGTNTAQVIHEFAPGVRVTMVTSTQEGRDWIAAHKDDIDLINVSRSASKPLAEYVYSEMEAYDIPLICSSGNDGDDDRTNYPARFPWTIAVGAYEYKHERIANYSNGGARLDCVATTDIYVWNSEKRPHKFNGTSAAAPSATGLLACWTQWRKEQGLGRPTTEEARAFIHENCIDLLDEGFDYKSGHGLFILPKEIPTIPDPEKDVGDVEEPKNDPKEDDNMPKKETKEFTDVSPDFWAHDAIQDCVEAGLVNGYSDGTFRPNNNLTRAQFCAIMAKFMKKHT